MVADFQDNYNCKSDMNLNLTTLPHGLGGNDSEYMVSGTACFFLMPMYCLFSFFRVSMPIT